MGQCNIIHFNSSAPWILGSLDVFATSLILLVFILNYWTFSCLGVSVVYFKSEGSGSLTSLKKEVILFIHEVDIVLRFFPVSSSLSVNFILSSSIPVSSNFLVSCFGTFVKFVDCVQSAVSLFSMVSRNKSSGGILSNHPHFSQTLFHFI